MRVPGFLQRAAGGTDSGNDSEGTSHTLLAVARVGGALELYSLPWYTRVWASDGLSEGAGILAPAGACVGAAAAGGARTPPPPL